MKNTKKLFLVAAAVVVVLSGCDLSLESNRLADLPSDVVDDVAREQQSFSFETYVSVGVELDLSLLDPLSGRSFAAVATPAATPVVIASITDSDGTLLYRGQMDADGAITGTFGIPTATDSISLMLEGPGVETRTVEISDPALLTRIRRKMALFTQGSDVMTRALSGVEDQDGDGVPDVYDAEPTNSDVQFVTSYPADGVFTVAFEDNYPALGDGDFNDFVVYYSLDVYQSEGSISYIQGTATARARAAGYDHEFGLGIAIPGFSGTVTSYYETSDGLQSVQDRVPTGEEVRVVIFPNTKQAFDRPTDTVTADNGYPDQTESVGYVSNFYIFPGAENTATVSDIASAPFNPYLLVHNTGYDVHLINRPRLPGGVSQVPEGEDFRDANYYPWALLVPVDFAHPIEGLDVPSGTPIISEAYLRFDNWVATEGDEDRDWYVDYQEDGVVLLSPNLK